ncbi:MAG: hypothetical protein VX262_01295 [Acidobacteriota bacterium]|nr:hypothetical protein [Acidobacteriota bacterium]
MSRFSQKIHATANSSWVFTRLRNILRASVVFNIAGTAVRSLSGPLAAIERSLQGRGANERRVEDDQCMVSLVERSVLMRNVERLVVMPVTAFRGARLGYFLGWLAHLELPKRLRLVGVSLSAALVAHTVTVSLAGVSIPLLGWVFRCGLIVVCLVFCFQSQAVAAAWSSWRRNTIE